MKIVNKVEKNRLLKVGQLFEELGFSKEESAEKAKGFMYIMIGWSILYWNNPKAKKNPEKEIKGLIELFGLEEIEVK